MSNPLTLRGVYTALITPLNRDQSIDYGALKNLVDWQIEQGVQGLVPMGTTGESPTIETPDHIEVIKTTVNQSNGRVPIIAGTGANSTHEAITLTQMAKDVGADASLQVAPYYNKPSQEGFYRHFSTIAEKAPLPQLLYNVPGRTGKAIDTKTILRLLENPLIIGLKDASGSLNDAMEIMAKDRNHCILSGDDNLSVAFIALGAQGVISVASNIIPKEMVTLIDAALEMDTPKTLKLFYELLPIFKAMFLESNPIPVKYIAAKIGLCEESYRLPLCEPSSENIQTLDALIEKFKIIF